MKRLLFCCVVVGVAALAIVLHVQRTTPAPAQVAASWAAVNDQAAADTAAVDRRNDELRKEIKALGAKPVR